MIDIESAREANKKFQISTISMDRGDQIPSNIIRNNHNGALDIVLHAGVENTAVKL